MLNQIDALEPPAPDGSFSAAPGSDSRPATEEGSKGELDEHASGAGPASRRFTAEDAVLYLLGVCLLLWPAWFFARSMDQLQSGPESALQVIARDWKPATIGIGADRYLAAQLYVTASRHEYASRLLIANSSRNNSGFVVGTLLAVMGCFLVIRGVRDSTINASVKATSHGNVRVLMTSPGVFVATLGTAIIIVTLLNNAKSELSDGNLTTVATTTVPAPGRSIAADVEAIPDDIIKQNLKKAGLEPAEVSK
jgi:hypothetical protein